MLRVHKRDLRSHSGFVKRKVTILQLISSQDDRTTNQPDIIFFTLVIQCFLGSENAIIRRMNGIYWLTLSMFSESFYLCDYVECF